MRRTGSRVRRGMLCTMIVAAGSAVFGVAGAGATVTSSTITSPSNPFLYQYNNDLTPAPTVTITGTTNSTAPGSDTIDLNCYYTADFGSLDYTTIQSGVALNPDGTFSWTGPVDKQGYSCQLRAVPHGYGDSYPLSSYSPVFSELDLLKTIQVNGTGSPTDDYFYTATSTGNYDDYESVGSCGLDFSEPMPSSTSIDENGNWDCAGALYGDDSSGTRTEILIDGKNAYDSAAADGAYSDTISSQSVNSGQAPGFPALTSSYVKDPASGSVTIHEAEGLVSCADATYPATQAKCGGTTGSSIGTWQSDGVSFDRTITQTAGGRSVTMTDTYTSTDAKVHSLDLEYDNYSDEDGDPVWSLPGTSGYQAYASGDQSSLSGNSMDVIYTKDGYYPDGSPYDGPGALIYNTAPNSAVFTGNQEMLLDYQRTVPAGGSLTITHTYLSAPDTASLQALVNGTVDQTVKPTVSITAPNSGSVTQQSSVQVTGRAAAHDGLTLKVNGQAVGVNPDGTWATSLSLKTGSNLVTAIASDGSGNTAQATDTVIYTPAAVPAPKFCIVPAVSKNKLAKAKTALKKADCKVGKISKVRSAKFKKGTVEHASYSAHVVLKAGTKVGLTEVIGKPKPKPAKHTARRKHTHRI